MTDRAHNSYRPVQVKDGGFTVVELLLSLVIVALILTLLPGTLRLNNRVWEVQDKFGIASSHSALDRYIDQRLSAAREIFERTESGNARLLFDGTPDRIRFVAPARSGPVGGGLYHFEVMLSAPESKSTQALTLRQRLYRPGGQGKTKALEATRRVPGVIKRLGFRYFGASKPGQRPGWTSRWQDRQSLPHIVEISIVARHDPSMSRTRSVRLHLASDS